MAPVGAVVAITAGALGSPGVASGAATIDRGLFGIVLELALLSGSALAAVSPDGTPSDN